MKTKQVLRKILSKLDFAVNGVSQEEAIIQYGKLKSEGNYVDACGLIDEFIFKFTYVKCVIDEMMDTVFEEEKEVKAIDTSIADFEE